MHYYKLNIADWNLSTAHLNPECEAIYFRLVNHYYDTETLIPLETQSVFNRLRLTGCEEIALGILGEFFELTDNGWKHKRCDIELKEYHQMAKKNRKNGSKGGRPKKNIDLQITQSVNSGNPLVTQTKPTGPNHKPLTKNHKPRTNNKDIRATLDFGLWPNIPSDQILKDYKKLRVIKKAPFTQTVVNSMGKQLTILSTQGITVDQTLEICCGKGWQGLKANWILKELDKEPINGEKLDLSQFDEFLDPEYR